jgi:hypothetical protein
MDNFSDDWFHASKEIDELILESIEIPKDKVILLVSRRPNETLKEWAKRCAVAYNIGETK